MFIQLIIKASGAGNKAQWESVRPRVWFSAWGRGCSQFIKEKKDKREIADICDYVWKFNYLIKTNV